MDYPLPVDRMIGITSVIEDWETVKKRWEAWWQGEVYDRPVLAVTAPRDGAAPNQELPVKSETQWTDVDFMVRRQLEILRTTYFGGEALPVFWHNWSAGHTLYFDCRPHFTPDTVWVDPAPVDKDGYPILEGWRENPWWQWMQDSTLKASHSSQGRYFVMPMWGNHAGDNLGLVRGTENLLMDIATHPAWVKAAVKKLSDIQIEVFDRLWELVAPEIVGVEGSINYVSCWSPARTMAFDCDLSCMVSPQDFRELFLPPLIETMHTVEHCIYHLDGWVALHHLDTLLDLPELHAIQWLPGTGREEIRQWIPVIQHIQSRRKGVAVYVQPWEIEPLLWEVKPEGLFINTSCRSEGEARTLLERVSAQYRY